MTYGSGVLVGKLEENWDVFTSTHTFLVLTQ